MGYTGRRKTAGFTLIELMIVVAIIGILAAIAIPSFVRFQLRSKTAEARTNIRTIKAGQESFRADHDLYAVLGRNGPAVPGPSKHVWHDVACDPGCNRHNPFRCNQYDCIGFVPDGPVYYQYESLSEMAGLTEYCVAAAGDLDGDNVRGGFEFQSSNRLGTTRGFMNCSLIDAGPCGWGMPGDAEMVDCHVGVY